jgi:hypothetical protein
MTGLSGQTQSCVMNAQPSLLGVTHHTLERVLSDDGANLSEMQYVQLDRQRTMRTGHFALYARPKATCVKLQ